MKKRYMAVLISILLIFSFVIPASAITDGEIDGNNHPQVVLIIMDVGGEPTYRCSGAMLSPRVVLTAGHCTSNYPDEPYSGIRIFTESDIEHGNNNYPDAGSNSIEAKEWHSHPLFETGPFVLHDVGIILLKKNYYPNGDKKFRDWVKLPEVGQLDKFDSKRGLQDTWFTAVGYGLQAINPVFVESEKVRMYAEPRLIQINVPGFTGDFSLLLSNNHATGGTCFGDSGGPNFITDTLTVAGVTSFGINGNCAGTGGVFRLDKQDVIDFVNGYLH
jgi:hypothetical protein